MKIITNNKPRFLVHWYELTNKEQKQFDYLKTEEEQANTVFFRYQKHVYCLSEFERVTDKSLEKWDGIAHDTFSSGVLCKVLEIHESVLIARFY